MPEASVFFTEIETRAEERARQLVESLIQQRLTLALAESCTAGLAADLLARVSGASAALWGSFVCYTAEAKQRMLGLDGGFLMQYGLVSRETARAMALHTFEKAGVSLAAAVTGIAGPHGDGSDTPVGTVWTAAAWQGHCREKKLHFQGTRSEIRMQAAAAVMEELLEVLNLPLEAVPK
ncbi:MAG: CinA family protein [Treponema sp.]|jgi:PncC family amidohydrolase|nr:CinA family protein [Treponema sp.]